MANPCHNKDPQQDRLDRLSNKHPNSSQLNPVQHAFAKRLGAFLKDPANGYQAAQASGLEVQLCNGKANCRRWCYDDPDDPYCCG